jgi:hypothetical protein
MSDAIVETNVAVIANGGETNASPACRLAAIEFLETIMHGGRIVIDLAGEVEEEYHRRLNMSKPGVGNRFLQRFFVTSAHKVRRVDTSDEKASFEFKGSLRRFDPSDRKFVFLAVATRLPVTNAVDSDWLEHDEALAKKGVGVTFLCGKDKRSWFI